MRVQRYTHNQRYFTTFMKFYQHKFVKKSSYYKYFRFLTKIILPFPSAIYIMTKFSDKANAFTTYCPCASHASLIKIFLFLQASPCNNQSFLCSRCRRRSSAEPPFPFPRLIEVYNGVSVLTEIRPLLPFINYNSRKTANSYFLTYQRIQNCNNYS